MKNGFTLFAAAILAGATLTACSKTERLVGPGAPAAGVERATVGNIPLASSHGDGDHHRKYFPWSTNPYFPLIPGTEWRYRQETADGVETQVVTVTSETERIAGVRTIVVKDVVRLDGEVIERTRDYYAMDDDGNVWYFGEDTRSFDPDTGEESTEGTWRAGRDGATQGIIMLAHPAVGDEYAEENAPGVAEDMARVVSREATVNVPAGEFDDCLKTLNFTPLEPGVAEDKYYAPGVGLVLEVDQEEDDRNELVRVTRGRDLARGSDDDESHGPKWGKFGKRRR